MVDKNKGFEEDDIEYLSKTQLKKLAHSLQDLAKDLSEMPKSKRVKLNLPDVLLSAIEESKRITSHIARKRHFQYMGKVLLKVDYKKIQSDIEQMENQNANYQIRDQVITLWIDHLLTDATPLLNALYADFDHDEVSSLRQLLRNFSKKPDHAATRKKLFQALRQMDMQHELPNPLMLITS